MTPFDWRRMPMEVESPEEYGYDKIRANLAESSLRDRALADLKVDVADLILLYGDHRGSPDLRSRVAASSGLDPDDVLCTAGGALALFLVAATLLGPDSEIVVARPNYVSNIETPRALGTRVVPLDLTFERSWSLDPDELRSLVTPRTRLVSLTSPHNPTGTELSAEVLHAVIEVVESQPDCYLLLDQTYAELSGPDPLPDVATLSDRAISVSGVSKTYGVPGIRQGWLTSRNAALMERLLALKEQVVLTGSVLDEAVAAHVLACSAALLPQIRADVARRRAIIATWMADHEHLEWVAPTGGVTAFPRFRAEAPVDPTDFFSLAPRPLRRCRRPRPLVRPTRGTLPARLGLADRRRADARPRLDRRGDSRSNRRPQPPDLRRNVR